MIENDSGSNFLVVINGHYNFVIFNTQPHVKILLEKNVFIL